MKIKERKLIITFGIVLIIFLIVIIIWDLSKAKQVLGPTIIVPDYSAFIPSDQNAEDTMPRDWEETDDRKAVPTGIKVPDANEIIPEELKEVIAVPQEVIKREQSESRIFEIRGENGKLIPEKVIVNYNDIVHINFTAVDGNYNIIFSGYNMMLSAKAGEKKVMNFHANQDGRFSYRCEECGGFAAPFEGEIIVVK